MSEMVTISNGEEFYRIPLEDLADAKSDGFYVPNDRDMTIVSDGQELFEVPLVDVAEAEADGFKDMLKQERAARSRKVASAAAIATPVLAGAEGDSFGSDTSFDTGVNYESGVDADSWQNSDAAEAVTAALADELDEVVDATEVDVDAERVAAEEEELRLMRQEEIAEATGLKRFWLIAKYNYLPDPEESERLAKVYGVAVVLHLAVGVIFAMWMLEVDKHLEEFLIDTRVNDTMKPVTEDEPDVEIDEPEPSEENEITEIVSDTLEENTFDLNINDNKLAAPTEMKMPATLGKGMPSVKLKGAFGGRSKAGRMSLVNKRGGSAASESAVQSALDWLVRHQVSGGPLDGSWDWNDEGIKGCTCGSHGALKHQGRMGATGMAILTFLGYGTTHLKFAGDELDEREERFRQAVARAFDFMMRAFNAQGADFRGGTGHHGMYCQGIAATAMCEAMAMNQAYIDSMDSKTTVVLANGKKANKRQLQVMQQRMRMAAIAATAFIVEAQDQRGGGWGYSPGSAGDTSILGWQVMALKSAYFSKIPVPPQVWVGVNHFLDGVTNDGSTYGYRNAQAKPSTTAIGLLTRMYTNKNINRDNPILAKGCQYLAKSGPQLNNMYYSYYGTQVMFHYGGDLWKEWNAKMRPALVNSQIKEGHEAGSWNLKGGHAEKGGRLFSTCLGAMTLEVYYRHMPLYKVFNSDEDEKEAKK